MLIFRSKYIFFCNFEFQKFYFWKNSQRIIDETARVIFTGYNYTVEFVEGSTTTFYCCNLLSRVLWWKWSAVFLIVVKANNVIYMLGTTLL